MRSTQYYWVPSLLPLWSEPQMLFLRPVVWHPLKVPKLSKLHFLHLLLNWLFRISSFLLLSHSVMYKSVPCTYGRTSLSASHLVWLPRFLLHWVEQTLHMFWRPWVLLKLRFLKTSLLHICRRGMLSLVIRTHAHTWARSLELIKSHSCFNGENRTLCPQRPSSAVWLLCSTDLSLTTEEGILVLKHCGFPLKCYLKSSCQFKNVAI